MAFSLIGYLRESRDELKKVAWPSRRETRNNTMIVIGISLFVTVFLGALDLALNFVFNKVFLR